VLLPPGVDGNVWILGRFAAARTGAHQNQPSHEFEILQREGLGDRSADREAEKIKLRKAERTHEVSGALGHSIDGLRRRTRRARYSGIVEEDHRAILGEPIGDRRIPIVHPTAEMLHKEERNPTFFAEPAISELNTVRLYKLCRRSYMGMGHSLPRLLVRVGRF
jgi:hypothetical protein